DPDGDDLEPAVDQGRDRSTARCSLHLELPERFSGLGNRLSELAGILHQFGQVSQLTEHVEPSLLQRNRVGNPSSRPPLAGSDLAGPRISFHSKSPIRANSGRRRIPGAEDVPRTVRRLFEPSGRPPGSRAGVVPRTARERCPAPVPASDDSAPSRAGAATFAGNGRSSPGPHRSRKNRLTNCSPA